MSTAENPDALTRRIERLAAASVDDPGEGAAVAALVGALRTEIGGVRNGLLALGTDTGAVRDEVESLGGRLSSSLDDGREQINELTQRVQDLAARLELVAGRVEELSDVLPPLSSELREGFRQVPVDTGERLEILTAELSTAVGQRIDGVGEELSQTLASALERQSETAAATASALEEARTTFESRLAVLEDTLDGVSERLEALSREGANATADTLRGLAGSVAALDERILTEAAQAEGLASERQDALDTRLDELAGTLLDRLRADLQQRDEALRAELVASLEAGRAEAREDRQAVSDLAVTVRGALEGFASVVDRSLSELGRSVTGALADSREETRGELDEMTERFATTAAGLQADLVVRDEAAAERVGALQADLVVRDEAAAGRLSTLQAQVEESGDLIRVAQAEAVAELRSEGASRIAGVTAQLDGLLPAVDGSLQEVRAEFRELGASVVSAQVEAVAENGEALRTAVASLSTELGASVQAQGEQVAGRFDAMQDGLTSRFDALCEELDRTTGSFAIDGVERSAELRGLHERARGELGELRGELAGRLDELATSLGGRVLTLETAFQGRIAELEATVASRLAEVGAEVGESTARSRESLDRLQALTSLAERQRAEAEQALEALRVGVAASGDDLRTQLLAATAERLEANEQRLSGLGQRIDGFDAALTGSTSLLSGRLDALGEAVTGTGEQTARVTEGLSAVRASTTDLQQTVGGFRDEWPTRTFEVVQGAKAVADGVVRDVRVEMQAQMDRVRVELARVVEGVAGAGHELDAGTERLSQAGHALLDYLDQRDRLLEAERDRVLHDILDAFASGLSSRERVALSGRVSDALTRRRDARDAQRYREVAGPSLPGSAGELPDRVKDLARTPSEGPRLPPETSGAETTRRGGPDSDVDVETRFSAPAVGASDGSADPGPTSLAAPPAGSVPVGSFVEQRVGSERRLGTRTISARGGNQPDRRREGTVVRGPRKVAATQDGSGARTVQARGPASASQPPAPMPAPMPAAGAPGPVVSAPGSRSTSAVTDPAEVSEGGAGRSGGSSDRRGRLDAMPQVPGPGRALDAAAPPPHQPAPQVETATGEAPGESGSPRGNGAEPPPSGNDDPRLFRRRKP